MTLAEFKEMVAGIPDDIDWKDVRYVEVSGRTTYLHVEDAGGLVILGMDEKPKTPFWERNKRTKAETVEDSDDES